MNYGWVYCFSNPAMPGLLKVGMIHNADERTPLDRAKELYKTGVPLPFEVEFAKKVSNPKQKETTLHTLLSQYKERPNPLREFFRVSPEEVKTLFDLMDGEMWVDTRVVEEADEEGEGEEDGKGKSRYVQKDIFQDQAILRQIIGNTEFNGNYHADIDKFITDAGVIHSSLRQWNVANSNVVGKSIPDCWKSFKVYDGAKYVDILLPHGTTRNMQKYFTHGQRICNTIGVNKTWIGTYDYARNGILYDSIFYKSLSGFVNAHHKINGTYTSNGVSGWARAKCEVDGLWISVSDIQPH